MIWNCFPNLVTKPIRHYIICVRSSRKDKKISKKSANVEMTEAASIQDSPTELNYAVTTKASNGDAQSMPVQQYDYARTGPVKVRFLN